MICWSSYTSFSGYIDAGGGSIMAFVKELVSGADKELYKSFEIYDYDHNKISGLKLYTDWAVDHDRKIYFTYVSGGALEHPEQYDLIWQGEKIVIFMKVSVEREPLKDNLSHIKSLYEIISIRAPKKFVYQQDEMIELIKEALGVFHSIDFIKGIPYENKNSITIANVATPRYYDEVNNEF